MKTMLLIASLLIVGCSERFSRFITADTKAEMLETANPPIASPDIRFERTEYDVYLVVRFPDRRYGEMKERWFDRQDLEYLALTRRSIGTLNWTAWRDQLKRRVGNAP